MKTLFLMIFVFVIISIYFFLFDVVMFILGYYGIEHYTTVKLFTSLGFIHSIIISLANNITLKNYVDSDDNHDNKD